jgi:hypothetical protein
MHSINLSSESSDTPKPSRKLVAIAVIGVVLFAAGFIRTVVYIDTHPDLSAAEIVDDIVHGVTAFITK